MLKSKATDTSEIRQNNLSRALDVLVASGSSTRHELARSCALSSASASNMVQDLMALGYADEVGLQPSGSGRPRNLVNIIPDSAYFVGADIGESELSVGLFNLELECVDSVQHKDKNIYASPKIASESLATSLKELKERNPGAWSKVKAIGLGLPGIVDNSASNEQYLYAQSIGWSPVPVAEFCGNTSLPIIAENGAKAFARAERRFGALKDRDDISTAIVVLIGRGVGMGVLTRHQDTDLTPQGLGEIGHTKISPTGPKCSCGARGCLEAFIGSDAIVESWYAKGGHKFKTSKECLAHILSASENDEQASQVLKEVISSLSIGLANVVNLFGPDLCIIGGKLGIKLSSHYINEISRNVHKFALGLPAKRVSVISSSLDQDATALGAALLAYQNWLPNFQVKSNH